MSGGRYALIVATDTYQDGGLERLLSPGQDATALADVLGDPEVGGFGVEVVRNEPAHVVARRVEDFFADRGRGDSLLLHFSCHGLKNPSGELFFAAADTLPRRLSSTAVSADFVRRCMAEGRARNAVLLLDCCYGGAFMEGMGPRAAGDANVLGSFSGVGFDSGRGWAVITASSAMEYAFEGTQLTADRQVRPSVFTRALTSGLASGEADLDADGRVSVNELYDYVYDRVRQENPHQTPSRSIHLQGDVYLARSRRRRTDAEGLPEELRLAVSSPDVFSRRGAVAELRQRLQSPDLAMAEAACRALHGLVRNDIRSIAEEAARALAEVGVRPLPERVDFGRIGQYAPEPHQRIQLLGPVLAHDCVPRPGNGWIRVVADSVSDTLDVSVDTSVPGMLEGTLTLEGRAGEALVPVRAEVVPAHVPVRSVPPSPSPASGGSPRADAFASEPAPTHRAEAPLAPVPRSWAASSAARTPLSAPAEQPYAGFGRRFAARAIDYVLVLLFALTAVVIVLIVMAGLSAPEGSVEAMANITAVLTLFGWGLLLFLYDWLFLRCVGATCGKMLLGVRVVDAEHGGKPSHGQAVGRAALFGLPQTVPVLGGLAVLGESLAVLSDPHGRAFHDRWAGTVVVHHIAAEER